MPILHARLEPEGKENQKDLVLTLKVSALRLYHKSNIHTAIREELSENPPIFRVKLSHRAVREEFWTK